ncbi:hypothetical protein POM88_052131 [Heracleum sosnowskyi]|uniref:Uncharacterized protein n=1 Tax=Heracleum sosnowskyi TaxID=360622 RepID=A0AAD8GSG3_9APIA|nr:hypothetical protein POM88_052131 [Heracleum sosnowskyi]
MLDRINSKAFKRDMARYTRDEKKSDGFDVGLYPYRDAAAISGRNFLFLYYKPPNFNLPKARRDTLFYPSQLAISVYNMHQVPPTHYDNVQVLKAMKFGTNLNLTFQASFPPVTFQTRLYDHTSPPHSPYYSFEIVLVRKADTYDQTDYVGVSIGSLNFPLVWSTSLISMRKTPCSILSLHNKMVAICHFISLSLLFTCIAWTRKKNMTMLKF